MPPASWRIRKVFALHPHETLILQSILETSRGYCLYEGNAAGASLQHAQQ